MYGIYCSNTGLWLNGYRNGKPHWTKTPINQGKLFRDVYVEVIRLRNHMVENIQHTWFDIKVMELP